MTEEEKITVRHCPTAGRHERRILCPECKKSRLPVHAVTECDKCGAHLEVYVKTVAPPVNDSNN